MNNWHSIALTGSSPPWSTRRLDIKRTSTSFTLLGVEVIVVLASLTLFSVQPRRALHFFLCSPGVVARKAKQNKNSRTSHAIEFCRAWRPLPTDPHTWKMASGCLGIWIPAVFCLCLEAKRRTRILWCSMKVRSPWAWSAGAGRTHRRTEHYLFILNWIELN